MNPNVKKVVSLATSWAGKNIHTIPGSPHDTCAFFVRHVFRNALHKAGEMRVAINRPYYKESGVRSLPTNENMADSLAGDEVGMKVPAMQMQPGDILLFKDTYYKPSEFPIGSITHVGICVGENGLMADSSGGLCHVRSHSQTFPGKLVEVRRPKCFVSASVETQTGITLNNGEVHAVERGNKTNNQEIIIKYGQQDPLQFAALGKQVSIPNPIKLLVSVNGKPFVSFKYVTVDIAMGGNHVKLFHHGGLTRAFVGGQETKSLSIVARLQGALHIFVNNKEVKPTAVNIGIS